VAGDKKLETTEGKSGEVAKAPASTPRALSPFDEMDRMFESFFPRSWMRPFRWEWSHMPEFAAFDKLPRVDVIDRDYEILVRAEVPGVDKGDLEVSVTDNTVTIKGSTRHEKKEEKGDFYRREISRGTFARTVALPSDVDGGQAIATFKDGILEITAPKIEKAKRRSVKVE
jgi:HSP20 family protein